MAGSISGFLARNKDEMLQKDLHTHLNMLLAKKKIRCSKVAEKSHLAKAYIYEIFSGKKKPSRDALIAIAIGMSLTIDETQQLLKRASSGELYVRNERDAVIIYAIHHKKDVTNTNILLEEYKLPILVDTER